MDLVQDEEKQLALVSYTGLGSCKLQDSDMSRFRQKQSPISDSKSIHCCGMNPKRQNEMSFWTFSLASKRRGSAMKTLRSRQGHSSVSISKCSSGKEHKHLQQLTELLPVPFWLCCSECPENLKHESRTTTLHDTRLLAETLQGKELTDSEIPTHHPAQPCRQGKQYKAQLDPTISSEEVISQDH